MYNIQFKDVKTKIINSIENRANKIREWGIKEPLSLIDGFVQLQLANKLDEKFYDSGKCVPVIQLLGEETGQIYYFALKALIDIYE